MGLMVTHTCCMYTQCFTADDWKQQFVTWQFIHALLCDALTSEINNNETKAEAMELEISEAEV